MAFTMRQKVLFKHCDPAGIVFYPRYFEMISDCVETFFDSELGVPFEELLKTAGVPTVQISAEFSARSQHGDMLDIALVCTRLGRSSLSMELTARCAGQTRFVATQTLVFIDTTGKAQAWTPALHAALEPHITGGK